MEDKVMHANVKIRDTQIMMSDGRCQGEAPKFDGFTLTLNVSVGRSGQAVRSARVKAARCKCR